MSLRTFRIAAIAEAITWVLLIIAAIAKRAWDVEWATPIFGPIHGIAVLVYYAGVSLLREELRWDVRRTIGALLIALVPLGTYLVVERRWLREAAA